MGFFTNCGGWTRAEASLWRRVYGTQKSREQLLPCEHSSMLIFVTRVPTAVFPTPRGATVRRCTRGGSRNPAEKDCGWSALWSLLSPGFGWDFIRCFFATGVSARFATNNAQA